MKKFVIDANKNCKLSDFIFQNFPQISYHTLQKMLRKKDVLINRERITKDVQIKKGDFIELYCPESSVEYFSVVYEDENVIVVNKAFGIIVATKDKTRPNELSLQELVEKQIHHKVLSIHRIDMNTSGLVIFCKSKKVFDELKIAMQNHEIEKWYMAEVVGKFNLPPATHKAFLTKNSHLHNVEIYDKKITPRAMDIETYVELVENKIDTSIVKVKISNGKTHQIRAHMAHLGFALVGDNKYGKKTTNKKFGTRKQKLLAQKIVFKITSNKLKYLNNLNIEIDKGFVKTFFNK